MKKYFVLHPGIETSIKDKEDHFIDAKKLSLLYHVDLSECYVVDYKRPETYKGIDLSDGLIHLYPRRFRDEYDRMSKMIDNMRVNGMFKESVGYEE